MKKQNYRAHKRALSVSRRKSNRNVELKKMKKIEKEMNESFSHQLDLFLDKIETNIGKLKFSINSKITGLKYAWSKRKIFRTSSTDFYDLATYFASRESISVYLAAMILINCFPTAKAKIPVPLDEQLACVEITEDFREQEEQTVEEDIKVEISKTPLNSESKQESVSEPEEKILTLDDMIKIIEHRYGVSNYEFLYTAAVCLLEAGENQYDGCYDVASIFLNRITNISTIDFVNTYYAPNTGTNIYAHAVCPGQFTVSKKAIAKLVNSDMTVYTGFEAVVKCFYTGIPSHNFYRFVAPHLSGNQPCVQLHPNGDYFFAEVQDKDRLSLEEVLPNYNSVPDSFLDDENEKMMVLTPNEISRGN